MRSSTPWPVLGGALWLLPSAALVEPAAVPVCEAAPSDARAQVTRIIDGDTLDVLLGGRRERVRLIGIDAPEKRTDDRPAEPYAKESTAFVRRQAGGRQVVLAADPGHEDRDRYGRLLRYVILPDGRCLNLELVCRGYARAYTRYRFTRQKEFRACEKQARADGRGLWASK